MSEPKDAKEAAGGSQIDPTTRALGPAADEFGKEIVPLGKKAGALTNRVGDLLLRALEPLVYGLEISANWIEKAVTDRLNNVPQDQIRPPNPRIAVPALQALTYSMEDSLMRDMFANLLAADMNAAKKEDAHPAFVEFIKEMTPADARVLKIARAAPQTSFIVRVGSQNAFYTVGTSYSFDVEGLSPRDISAALNNLERLGLLERRDEFQLSDVSDQTEAKLKVDYEQQRQGMDVPEIKKGLKIPDGGRVEVIVKRQGLYMTPLGVNFARICLG